MQNITVGGFSFNKKRLLMQPCLVANSGCASGKENLRRAQAFFAPSLGNR
jgi:hypothetical protein